MSDPRDNPEAFRHVPYNVEIEQALLGSILVDQTAYYRLDGLLTPDAFYDPLHSRIFEMMGDRLKRKMSVTPVTLHASMKSDPGLMEVGGTQYLANLAMAAPAIPNIKDFARELHDLAMRRKLIKIGEDLVNAAYEPPNPERDSTAEAIANEAAESIYDVSRKADPGRGAIKIKDLMAEAIDKAEHAANNPAEVCLTSGLKTVDQELGGIYRSDLTIVAGAPNMGKAQPLNALVLTPGGFRQIGDLTVGDTIASIDGQASSVAGVYPQGTKDIFEIEFADGRKTRACADHLWRAFERRWPAEGRVLSTVELQKYLTAKCNHGRIYVPLIEPWSGCATPLPLDPYVLGVLLGDGCIIGDSPRFSSADPEIIETVTNRLRGMAVVIPTGRYGYRITGSGRRGVGSNPVTVALKRLGLWGLNSSTKFVPDIYLNASLPDRMELLRGLLDTDGTVETFGPVSFSSVSKQLAEDVQYLARSIGAYSRMRVRTAFAYKDGKKKKGLPAYRVGIRYRRPADLFALTRKKNRTPKKYKSAETIRLAISSIKLLSAEKCVCIRVSHPSALYVTDDFVVTHNSAFAESVGIANGRGQQYGETVEDLKIERNHPRAPVLSMFYSLEMADWQLGAREVSQLVNFPSNLMRRGKATDIDLKVMRERLAAMPDVMMKVDGGRKLSVQQIRARCHAQQRYTGNKLGLVLIDHLRFVRPANWKLDEKDQIQQITSDLKDLAVELNVAVVLLAHLNRDYNKRPSKRPVNSDLYGASAIEQNADAIWFLHSEHYFLEREEVPASQGKERAAWQAAVDREKGWMEIFSTKARMDKIGKARVRWEPAFTRFTDPEWVQPSTPAPKPDLLTRASDPLNDLDNRAPPVGV